MVVISHHYWTCSSPSPQDHPGCDEGGDDSCSSASSTRQTDITTTTTTTAVTTTTSNITTTSGRRSYTSQDHDDSGSDTVVYGGSSTEEAVGQGIEKCMKLKMAGKKLEEMESDLHILESPRHVSKTSSSSCTALVPSRVDSGKNSVTTGVLATTSSRGGGEGSGRSRFYDDKNGIAGVLANFSRGEGTGGGNYDRNNITGVLATTSRGDSRCRRTMSRERSKKESPRASNERDSDNHQRQEQRQEDRDGGEEVEKEVEAGTEDTYLLIKEAVLLLADYYAV